MLELKGVSKIYKTKSQDVHALDKIDLVFQETGLVFVTGKSGSGKTTLLNVIGGLDNFEEGEIIIKDKSTKDFTKSDFDSYRNTYIGFVFQEYNLLDNMTIEKNLSLATELQGKKIGKEEINDILKQVDLEGISPRKPQELSGGQRQRVAIARALIKDPSIIMADEPTGALDTANGLQVMTLLKKLSKDKLVIVVSHDLELADKFADRIINLEDGHIESDITIKVDQKMKDNLASNNGQLAIRRGAKLNDTELENVRKAVASGKDVVVTDNINVTRKNTGKVETKQYQNTKFIRTHMGLWDTLKLGVNTLRSKKIRLTVTIVLCAIAFAIFGIFDSLAIYEEDRLTANTLRASLSPSTTITANIKEENGNSYAIHGGDVLINSLNSRTGYNVKGVYDGYYVGSNVVPTELTNNNPYKISRYYYYKKLIGAVEFDEKDLNSYKFSMLAGRLPENYDEVAISEYFANCMINWWYTYRDANNNLVMPESIEELATELESEQNCLVLSLGTTATKKTYKIVGIVNTGKINKRFDWLKDPEAFEKATSLQQNEYLNYINNSFCLYLFTKPGFSQNAISSYRTLTKYINSAYSFEFNAENNSTIETTATAFYDFAELKNSTGNYFFLDKTQTELGENEILVDLSQFKDFYNDKIIELMTYATNSSKEKHRLLALETTEKLDRLKNGTPQEQIENLQAIISNLETLQHDIDGLKRTESIFARTFVSKKFDTSRNPIKEVGNQYKFKIVGFYTGLTGVNSFIMETTGLNKLGISILQGRFTTFLATNLGKGDVGKLTALLLNDRGLFLSTNNSALATVRANTDFFSRLSILFLIVSAVFAVFSVVMFYNFISTSIKNKYTEIGILRALGARGIDILKMFLVESVVLALINAVFASAISAIGCIFVNMFLSNILNIAIPLAAFGMRQVGIILALSILVGAISAIIPIWSVSKQKPVETIRKAF